MKLLDIIKAANHNLFRSKLRTFLTILAIFVGSFTIIMTSAINNGVNDFIDKQVESIGGEGYIEIAPTAMYDQLAAMMDSSTITEYDPHKNTGDATRITEDDLAKIRTIDGVISVRPYYMAEAEYITGPHTDKKFNASLTTLPSNRIHTDMLAGRQIDADSSDYEIMITEDYAKALGYDQPADAVGQTATIGVKQPIQCYATPDNCIAELEVKIVGVQAPGVLSMIGSGARINLTGNDAIYDLQTKGVTEDVKNRTSMALGEIDPAKTEQVKSDLEKLGFTAITVADEVSMVRSFFDIVLIVLDVFGGIALLAAAIGIINTLFMSVTERRREIGLMKALGMSNAKVFLSFSAEAILIGFWGSVFGIGISALIGAAFNSIASSTFLSDFPTFQLVQFQPLTLLTITLIIMLIAFIAGTAPAYKASRENPIDALRSE